MLYVIDDIFFNKYKITEIKLHIAWQHLQQNICQTLVLKIRFSLLVSTNCSIFGQFIRENSIQLHQHVRLEFSIGIDFSFHLFILCQSFLYTVFGI